MAISLYRKTYPGGRFDTFNIVWTPYYLNYDHSVDKQGALADERLKHMTADERAKLVTRMECTGRAVRINFKWGGKIGPDTRAAHRLIYLVQSSGKDEDSEVRSALVEGLFEAYHCLEKDVSEREVLRDIAVRAGVDAAEVDSCLGSELGGDAVDRLEKECRQLTNSGVPMFIIQGEHHGAADAGDLMEVFIKVRER